MCVSGSKKYSFFGKFGMLCFLETSVLRFAFLPYHRRFIHTLTNSSLMRVNFPISYTARAVFVNSNGSAKKSRNLFLLYEMIYAIYYHLYKRREKHPWRSVTFSKVAGWTCNFTKCVTPPWVFFTILKLYKC